MKKFRFIGDQEKADKYRKNKPIPNKVYLETDFIGRLLNTNVFTWAECIPDEWEEVIEKETMITDGKITFTPITKPLHKDTDLGYFAGLAMVEFIRQYGNGYNDRIASESIAVAEELIKQLNEKWK